MAISNGSIGSQIQEMKKRKSGEAHRSSAVFPLFVDSTHDTILTFDNYWVLKNKLNPDNLKICVLFCDLNGNRLKRLALDSFADTYNLSAKEILETRDRDEQYGSIEIEITSSENLRMPFPAVNAYYRGESSLSIVHSSYRYRNDDEALDFAHSDQSNFLVSHNKDWAPWLFLIGDEAHLQSADATFYISSASNRILFELSIPMPVGRNTSKFVKLSEFAEFNAFRSSLEFNESAYFGIRICQHRVFTRVIGGSMSNDSGDIVVLHSFPRIVNPEYFVAPNRNIQTFLPIPTAEEIFSCVTSFPTNGKASFEYLIASSPVRKGNFVQNDKSGNMVFISPGLTHSDDLVSVETVHQSDAKIPVRTNYSYIFSLYPHESISSVLHSCPSQHTEIPLAHKVIDFPLRRYQWGNGFISTCCSTKLMTWFYSPCDSDSEINFELTIRVAGIEFKLQESVRPNSSTCKDIGKLCAQILPDLRLSRQLMPVYWSIQHDECRSESFSIVTGDFNGKPFMAGEHGY